MGTRVVIDESGETFDWMADKEGQLRVAELDDSASKGFELTTPDKPDWRYRVDYMPGHPFKRETARQDEPTPVDKPGSGEYPLEAYRQTSALQRKEAKDFRAREIIGKTNLVTIKFQRDGNGKLRVVQGNHWQRTDAEAFDERTVFEVPVDDADEYPRPTIKGNLELDGPTIP